MLRRNFLPAMSTEKPEKWHHSDVEAGNPKRLADDGWHRAEAPMAPGQRFSDPATWSWPMGLTEPVGRYVFIL